MARTARIVIPNIAHHITQRGNNCQTIFFKDEDRLKYLAFLHKSTEMYGVRILAYCLMTNHIHLIAVPLTEKALSKAIGRTHLLYAQCMQRSLGRSGHFWQGRYYSCPLDDAHAHNAAAYIELNPVRAGMVKKAWEYTWSSAVVHALGREDRSGLLDTKQWFESMSVSEWQMTLEAIANSEEITNEIRKSTCTGRPLGDNAFLKYVEANIEHPLPVSRGRPQKNNNC